MSKHIENLSRSLQCNVKMNTVVRTYCWGLQFASSNQSYNFTIWSQAGSFCCVSMTVSSSLRDYSHPDWRKIKKILSLGNFPHPLGVYTWYIDILKSKGNYRTWTIIITTKNKGYVYIQSCLKVCEPFVIFYISA